jgi:hypothetical protein
MKIGDLITKKANSRLYNETTPPLRTVVRVIKSNEPRLHGKSHSILRWMTTLANGKTLTIILLCLRHKVFYSCVPRYYLYRRGRNDQRRAPRA